MTEQLGGSAPQDYNLATGPYHADHMPLPEDSARRALVEKRLAGEPLTLVESMQAGRDNTVDMIGEYPVRPDHVYRSVGYEALAAYQETGLIISEDEGLPYAEGNNGGIDWYLGGVAPKYGNGEVILEAPADTDYFQPAGHMGTSLAKDPKVRHFKSYPNLNPDTMASAREKPVHISFVNAYQKNPDGSYARVSR